MNRLCSIGLVMAGVFCSNRGALADYTSEVLSDSPVAYWHLDDADGTDVADASGNGHHGTVDGVEGSITFGEPGLLPAEPGGAAITLAGLDRIVVPGFDKIGPDGYTAEYWVNMDQLPTGFLNLVGDGTGGGTFFMMNYTNPSGIIRPHFSFANSPVSTDSTLLLVPGTTYHIVTTWDPAAATGNIYINGALHKSVAVTGNQDPANESNQVYIGRDDREATVANFKIDEVSLYDRALTAERIAEHWAAGSGGIAPPINYEEDILSDSPVAYWRLGEPAGPAAADSSGNGHDATADAGVAFGQASLVPPDSDTAAALNGEPRITSAGFEKVDTGFSVECWVLFNSAPAGGAFSNLVGDGESAGDFNLVVQAGGAGIIRAHVQTDLGTVSIDSPDSLIDERQHHVVSTWDAATGDLRLYIDKVEVASANLSGTAANSDNPIFIGRDGREPGAFDGVIDEVAIYDHPLSPQRVASHFGWVDVPPPPKVSFGVAVGNSTLIGELHYSDSFTTTANGGAPGREGSPPYPVGSPGINVEDNYGNPVQAWSDAKWSIDTDAIVNDPAGVFAGSGAGSATGMTQTGGGTDYGLGYGIADEFIVQFDAFQSPDRIDITAAPSRDTIAGGLAVFFRTTGHPTYPEIGLYNGATEINSGLTSGIANINEWHNYAVRYDTLGGLIEVYVDEVSRGTVDLTTLDGGSHNTASNAAVSVGGTPTSGTRFWSDNFQVGSPGASAPLAITDFSYDTATGDLSLTWNSRPDAAYILEVSFDLTGWLEINDGIASQGQSTSHMENLSGILPPGKTRILFRIREF